MEPSQRLSGCGEERSELWGTAWPQRNRFDNSVYSNCSKTAAISGMVVSEMFSSLDKHSKLTAKTTKKAMAYTCQEAGLSLNSTGWNRKQNISQSLYCFLPTKVVC